MGVSCIFFSSSFHDIYFNFFAPSLELKVFWVVTLCKFCFATHCLVEQTFLNTLEYILRLGFIYRRSVSCQSIYISGIDSTEVAFFNTLLNTDNGRLITVARTMWVEVAFLSSF